MDNGKECETAGQDKISLHALRYRRNLNYSILFKKVPVLAQIPKSITKAFIKVALISTNELNIRF